MNRKSKHRNSRERQLVLSMPKAKRKAADLSASSSHGAGDRRAGYIREELSGFSFVISLLHGTPNPSLFMTLLKKQLAPGKLGSSVCMNGRSLTNDPRKSDIVSCPVPRF